MRDRLGGQARMRHTQAAGFSLMEMLVAMVIIGTVFTLILGTLDLTLQDQERAAGRQGQADRQISTMMMLHRLLGSAVPPASNQAAPTFRGEKHSVGFVARGPLRSTSAGYFFFDLLVVREGEAQALVLRYSPVLEGVSGNGQVVLLDDLRSAEFRYTKDLGWRDKWMAGDGFPDAVELAFQPKFGAPRKVLLPVHAVAPAIADRGGF